MILQQRALELRRVAFGIEHKFTQCLGRLGPWATPQADQAVLQVQPGFRGEQYDAPIFELLRDA
jgi:hypothetical protein